MQIFLIPMPIEEYEIKFNFVAFKKTKMTSHFDLNEAATLTNLTKVWQD